MTDAEVQGMAGEMELQRNWALTRSAQLAAALGALQARVAELEATIKARDETIAKLEPTVAVVEAA